MDHSEVFTDVAAAFAMAQAEMTSAMKDAKNPHFNSAYATLSSVSEACRPALNKHGIGVLQTSVPVEAAGRLCVETTLLHKSGQWLRSRFEVRIPKDDPQGYGSALTYLRRYALASMTGVCPADDDGNGATPETKPQQQVPRQQSKPVSRPASKPATAPQQPTAPQAETGEAITDKQQQEIYDLLGELANHEQVLAKIKEAYRVTSIEGMTSAQAENCLPRLRKTAEAAIAARSNQAA